MKARLCGSATNETATSMMSSNTGAQAAPIEAVVTFQTTGRRKFMKRHATSLPE
jgi:hypothetical protein